VVALSFGDRDAIFATILVAGLAITMVVAVQAFDGLVVRGGGSPVLPLDPLFNGIAARPTAPEFWWIYALLISSLIPSLVNLMIGGASLARGLPGVPSLLLRYMPAGKAVPQFDRPWIALILTLQTTIGSILGIAAQVFLIMVVIGHILPWLGLGILDMARDVAAFNLPARIESFFASIYRGNF
jgi:hypothetical protein